MTFSKNSAKYSLWLNFTIIAFTCYLYDMRIKTVSVSDFKENCSVFPFMFQIMVVSVSTQLEAYDLLQTNYQITLISQLCRQATSQQGSIWFSPTVWNFKLKSADYILLCCQGWLINAIFYARNGIWRHVDIACLGVFVSRSIPQ